MLGWPSFGGLFEKSSDFFFFGVVPLVNKVHFAATVRADPARYATPPSRTPCEHMSPTFEALARVGLG
jgi:hypothetical protein